jgi:hypothetical protein
MGKFLSTPLPATIGKEFFIKTLKDGHILARELLKILNFERGRFFVITSALADISKLQELRYGGILPVNPLEKIKVMGREYPSRKKGNSIEELAKFIDQSLIKDCEHWCVFEDVAFEKGDKCLSKSRQSDIRYFENQVYYCISGVDASKEKLSSLIKTADAQWYYMNVITETVLFCDQQQLSIDDIKKLATHTKYLVLGAYDMEGYVCFEKMNR